MMNLKKSYFLRYRKTSLSYKSVVEAVGDRDQNILMTVADDTQPDTLSYLVFSQQPFLSTGEHSTLLAVVLVFIVCHSVRIIIKVKINIKNGK